mmetsp:Transcript_14775/g.29127  ORF Transcript_14775/g.29127 Transcript_14775/m.29127 type:complete len:282 (-) Transcript_14775:122-967(-)
MGNFSGREEKNPSVTVEPHQVAEVNENVRQLKLSAAEARKRMARTVCFRVCADDEVVPSGLSKKLFIIRHGEGHHNVAQREWRAKADWDGVSEPYTIDTDPDFRYEDPALTDKGEGEARLLQARASAIKPEILLVSPMRRAIQTGLLAFEAAVNCGSLKALAVELAHERGGKHTCDKRLSKKESVALFPKVDFSLIKDEQDPFWGNGAEREPWQKLADRACDLLMWIAERPENEIALAAHSAILLALLNVPMDAECERDAAWLGTGEMRALMLTFSATHGS